MTIIDVYVQLFNTYRSFATESEREGISQNLQQTEDWLYEDGDDESEIVYTEKLAHLKQVCLKFFGYISPSVASFISQFSFFFLPDSGSD